MIESEPGNDLILIGARFILYILTHGELMTGYEGPTGRSMCGWGFLMRMGDFGKKSETRMLEDQF